MYEEWTRIDTKGNKILFKIILNDDLDEIWNNNEHDMKHDGFSKNHDEYNNSDVLLYWIEKDENDENDKIIEFKEKCKKWEIKEYVEKDIYLTINKNIDFSKFGFIKDENFNEEWKNYLFCYDNLNTYIKLNNMNISVKIDNFNNKYIEINENNKIFDDFMKNLENKIIECKDFNENKLEIEDEYQYKHYKNDNGYYKFKVKKDNIEVKQYDNANVYIKCNRIWKMNYQKKGEDIHNWGVSLIVDKIC